MSVKMGGVILAVAMLAILIAGLWLQYSRPRQIVGHGEVRVDRPHGAGPPVVLRTRRVRTGTIEVEEVELAAGTWIDCAGDCGKAAREAGPEFWRTIERNAGGR